MCMSGCGCVGVDINRKTNDTITAVTYVDQRRVVSSRLVLFSSLGYGDRI